MSIQVNQLLDVKGLNCPMPIVKAKQKMDTLKSGEILEVQATDPGSSADFKGWAKQTGHILLEENQLNNNGQTVYQFILQHK